MSESFGAVTTTAEVLAGVTRSPVTEGRRTRGDQARHSIVVVAERLFAEHGIHGVSLRDVSTTAGHRNNSAVQYYFGDRRGLVAAVYSSHMTTIDQRRVSMLIDLDPEAPLDSLVRVVVAPLVEEITTGDCWYGRFLAGSRWDALASEVIADLGVTRGLVAAAGRLRAHLRDLPGAIRRHRLDQVLSTVIATLASWEWARDRGEPRLDPERLTGDLVATSTAILLAPHTDSPTLEAQETP
jgi:AcrR family transcriptional regulator